MPKFVDNDIVVNFGDRVVIDGNSSRKRVVEVDGAIGRGLALREYYIVPQEVDCDAIIKINYNTMKT